MIRFSHPAYLWALSGILIPLVIHLLSRKEGKVIMIGSIRHFHSSVLKSSKSLRLNELLLLALRILIVTLLAALIAGLFMPLPAPSQKWLVIEKGIEKDRRADALRDSLEAKDYKTHFLSDGFPLIHDSAHATQVASYWKQVELLKSHDIDTAIVLSYNRAEAFSGKRIPLPPYIKWIPFDPAPADYLLNAMQVHPDTILLRTAHTSKGITTFEYQKITGPSSRSTQSKNTIEKEISIKAPDTLSFSLVTDKSHALEKKILLASLEAIRQTSHQPVVVSEIDAGNFDPTRPTDWVCWLVSKPVPAGVTASVISLGKQPASALIVQQSPDSWTINSPLTEDNAIQQNLSTNLFRILFPGTGLEQRAASMDRRTLAEEMMWSTGEDHKIPEKTNNENANTNLTAIALLLFLVVSERIIARMRNQ